MYPFNNSGFGPGGIMIPGLHPSDDGNQVTPNEPVTRPDPVFSTTHVGESMTDIQDRAHQEAQADFKVQEARAQQNALRARVDGEMDRQEAMAQFFGVEYSTNQRLNNFGWTGGALTDEKMRMSYLQSSANAKLYTQKELMRAGLDSELAVAREFAALKQIELANQYYDMAVKNAVAASEGTGFLITPETQEELNNFTLARSILDNPNSTEEERVRANEVLEGVRIWAISMFGNDFSDDMLQDLGGFVTAVREFNMTVQEKIRRASMEASGMHEGGSGEETPAAEPFDPSQTIVDVYDNEQVFNDMIGDGEGGFFDRLIELNENGELTKANLQSTILELVNEIEDYDEFLSVVERGFYNPFREKFEGHTLDSLSAEQKEKFKSAFESDGLNGALNYINGLDFLGEAFDNLPPHILRSGAIIDGRNNSVNVNDISNLNLVSEMNDENFKKLIVDVVSSSNVPNGSFIALKETANGWSGIYIENGTAFETESRSENFWNNQGVDFVRYDTIMNPDALINGIDLNSIDVNVTSTFWGPDYSRFGKSPLGVGHGGKQDQYVNDVIEAAKNGKIPNGTIINLNDGVNFSDRTRDIFVYRDGNFYPVGDIRELFPRYIGISSEASSAFLKELRESGRYWTSSDFKNNTN